MLRKITLLLFTVVLFAANCTAQSDNTIGQSDQACRTKMIERVSTEAAKLGLKVQGDYAFQSVGTVLMVVVPVLVDKNDRISPKSITRGSRIKFAYVEAEKPIDLPNGFYFIQSPAELTKGMAGRAGKNLGVIEEQKVTFISTDGRTTKDLPGVVAMYQLPKPIFRHYWTRISINGVGLWVDGEPE